MLRYLLAIMKPVWLRDYSGPPPWPTLVDADDEPIWATAVVSHAAYVVSDNTLDFPPLVLLSEQTRPGHVFGGVEYLTAIELVQDVLDVDAATIYGDELPRVLRRSGQSEQSLRPFLPGNAEGWR